jgi:hypothetical protein
MAIATGQLRLLLLPQHFHAGSQCSYYEKFSIRRPAFTRPMVDDCTRAWECWSGQQGSLDSEPYCPDQHSHAGSQFIPGGAQHSLAGMHASYCERLHSSMGVLGWQ